MVSGNPTLTEETFKQGTTTGSAEQRMTVAGTINKTVALFLILLLGASISWYAPSQLLMIGGAIGGFIVAMITIFKKEWSPFTAPLYAGLEGLFLGAVSVTYAQAYGGIVFNAVLLTLGVFAAMLTAYRSGLIEVTKRFRMGVVAATGGIALVYFASFILSFFGVNVSLIHGNGFMGIGFSLIIVGVAALNLVLDFDMIEQGAEANAPKYFEWYTSFGLMITLVWLYLELLRLLAKLQRR
ncbi:putative membrane protein, YccA/Bax inhibitor family [Fodinibius salinus]|uniref:Putative membrane protein, YccA/Bax inhibitor family n=1 Tax=Fodinibius salinus TaxID=860790 RepID=A0A5D3YNB6_9BACT|nr:Bax inhibitor-1/YccA family protein [Fodinibius salinus]TYP95182.1 putative membrane protein, YccA/Bax inhibitor family [Fodinibius salinus]